MVSEFDGVAERYFGAGYSDLRGRHLYVVLTIWRPSATAIGRNKPKASWNSPNPVFWSGGSRPAAPTPPPPPGTRSNPVMCAATVQLVGMPAEDEQT
jgi:hypothetical protein